MRKSLVFAFVFSVCMLDCGAFAATSRGSGRTVVASSEVSEQGSVPVVSRAASARQVSTASRSSGDSGTARSAVSATVVSRAATQKALNMGTKVATASANTVVAESCQDAYYGCMDAFCMLDNAAGGRCQCNDRITELNAVLDEILLLDEQSTRIATEGVEKVQMGEYADKISNKAKSIEAEIGSSKNSSIASSSTSTSVGVLDLSAWSSSGIFDNEVEEDDMFADTLVDDISNKTGDSLQRAAAKVCVAKIPTECKSSSALLQMAYVQKIRSDCVGYENALKQQKSASQQKLLTAQKAVRDAVLTEVREQNKYATAGECALAFANCMQTTAECGSDYTGCVTLAAAENVKNNTKGSKAKQTKIKGLVSGADITLAATTMEQLLAKKEFCTSVTRQCVDANKNDVVWDIFLRNAAPALKSAELIAEQNLRSACIPTVAECFKNACKAQFLDNEANYDICLSSPQTYKSLCKVQLEPCLEATGGTYDEPEKSSLWNGLVALLNSMKVDTCTEEVKDCLTERCGSDYSGCVGLSTYSIGNLCPTDKLTACMTATNPKDGTPYYKDEAAIREYVAEIAKGLALQIDNSLVEVCQNAANEALIKVCGDTESCDGVKLDLSELENMLKVQACKWNDATGESLTCFPDLSQFSDDDIYTFKYDGDDANAKLIRIDESGYGVYAALLDGPDFSHIIFGEEGENASEFSFRGNLAKNFSAETTQAVVDILNATLNRMVAQIEIDPKVVYCKTGREVEGFDGSKFGKKSQQGRFPNLTEEYKYTIANALLNKLSEKNIELQEKFSDEMQSMNNKITERIAEIAKKRGDAVETAVDTTNQTMCASYAKPKPEFDDTENNCGQMVRSWQREVTGFETSYDPETNVCTKRNVKYSCLNWRTPFWCHNFCDKFDDGKTISSETIVMPKFQ